MTKEQITYILDNIDEVPGTWITMENYYRQITLKNDKSIFLSPSTIQVFFDNDDELMYARYTDDRVIKEHGVDPLKDDEVVVGLKGKAYRLKLIPWYKELNDKKFHYILKYDIIDGFLIRE